MTPMSANVYLYLWCQVLFVESVSWFSDMVPWEDLYVFV